MATRKINRADALLDRVGVIDKCDVQVHIHIDRARGQATTRKSSFWLELEGTLTEPVTGSTRFSLHVIPGDPGDLSEGGIPSLGSWTRVRPMLRGLVRVTDVEFSVLTQLANANRLTAIGLAFHQPFRNHALIVRTSFGSGNVE